MRESSKAALGGVIASLSVVIMLVTYLSPLLVYTAPMSAGLLLIPIVSEMGYHWALGTYAAVGTLSVFMIADKEAAVFYVMFFGYFPVLNYYLKTKVKSIYGRQILNFLIFNISLAISVCICAFVLHIDYSDFSTGGKTMIILSWFMMNLLFVLYQFMLAKLNLLYNRRLKQKISGMFRH